MSLGSWKIFPGRKQMSMIDTAIHVRVSREDAKFMKSFGRKIASVLGKFLSFSVAKLS